MTRLRDIPAPTGTAISRFLIGRRAPKIFAIGFNKTGTTSLHHLFEDLGYRSLHADRWRQLSDPLLFRLYDAFSDGFPENVRAWDTTFPNARFILQVRDLDTWINSRLEHIRRLPPRKDRDPGWNFSEDAVESWVMHRNAYHLDTITYFSDKPGKLLVVNYIRDPAAAITIANFLGRPFSVKKAHANRNPGASTALENAAMIARVLTRLGIPETEWKNDIHCPSLSPVDTTKVPADTNLL